MTTASEQDERKEKVAFVQDRIHDALHEGLDEQWENALREWEEASPSRRDIMRTHVSGLRNRVWNSLSDIRSVGGLEKGLAIQYIKLKARWTMLNTQIQSKTATGGTPDSELVYRATCVSLIIQALEPLLQQKQIDRLTESVQ